MFSLIITIISIALVAALALATLYYGGDAFKRGAASADATKLHVQAQQLQGAAELYKADTGAYPLTMEVMLTGNYLKSIPVSGLTPGLDPAQEPRYGSSPSLLAQASAAGVVWKMVLPGQPVFAMTPVSVAVCEAVNKKAYGISGILKSARSTYSTQCFGTDLANLTMVTTKSGAALITASLSPLAAVSLGTVLASAPPAVNSGDTTAAGWLTVEGVTVAAVGPSDEDATPVPDDGVYLGITPDSFSIADFGDLAYDRYFETGNPSMPYSMAQGVDWAYGCPAIPPLPLTQTRDWVGLAQAPDVTGWLTSMTPSITGPVDSLLTVDSFTYALVGGTSTSSVSGNAAPLDSWHVLLELPQPLITGTTVTATHISYTVTYHLDDGLLQTRTKQFPLVPAIAEGPPNGCL